MRHEQGVEMATQLIHCANCISIALCFMVVYFILNMFRLYEVLGSMPNIYIETTAS